MHRFRARILGLFVGIFSILLLVLGVFLVSYVERLYKENLIEQMEGKAEAMAILTSHYVDDLELLQAKVQEIAPVKQRQLTIIASNGDIVAASYLSTQYIRENIEHLQIETLLEREYGTDLRYQDDTGTEMLYVVKPIYDIQGDYWGIVRYAVTMEEVDQMVHQIWYTITVALLVALILFWLASRRIAKGVAIPIEAMTQVAKQIAHGDYGARVRLRRNDEIGMLTDAINNMAENLEWQMKKNHETQQTLEGIIQTMTSGILLVNQEGRIILSNPATERLLGFLRGELEGKFHMEAVRYVGLSEKIEACLRTGQEVRGEIHGYYPDDIILDSISVPFLDDEGNVRGVLTLLHDITNIRRLEKIRSQFVANVSHELKTPITSIKGFAETLLEGELGDAETLRQFLQIIYDESERLHRLIIDLLDLSKIEQGKEQTQKQLVDFVQLVDHVMKTQSTQAKTKSITMSSHCPNHPVLYLCNHDQMIQVLTNLIGNAIAYTPMNGAVKIDLVELEQSIQLAVQDNGVGIPRDDLPRIFERFYRVDKARSRDSGGTGLGLSIVKHIVESHHGEIQVESRLGQGSTFTVILPKIE
ncbi:two-component system histidine kinase PnpS [Rubeoparvulum massiliense]|uniref:two-component system histidine kinase PnpS n=1 Tax=Rubeoparvulum massiliense TaxID=1631346 RepID=UPI00065DD787|nr:ATP-binding protein [Rubeoparvulum massiliense]